MPFAGFVPMAIVTVLVAVVTSAPCASTMRTCTAGVIAVLCDDVAGCTRNCSAVATGGTVEVTLIDCTDVRPVALNVIGAVPLPTTERFVNVAMPDAFVVATLPRSEPAGHTADTVIGVGVPTGLPFASTT